MKNQTGLGNSVDLAAPYARSSGQGALVGTLFGVAEKDLLINEVGAFKIKGIFELIKLTADVVTVGQKLYWDNTNKWLTTTVGSNQLVGKAMRAQSSSDTVALALLINV